MRLGAGRLGSRDARLGGGAALVLHGGIYIDYRDRRITRQLSAAVADDAAARVTSHDAATIGSDPPARIER